MTATAKVLSIGPVRLSDPVILAPMAGVCDLPYRVIAHRYGAALVCTEMVSDKGLLYHNVHTQDMLRMDPSEHPVSMQILVPIPLRWPRLQRKWNELALILSISTWAVL